MTEIPDDLLDLYFRDVGAVPLLTADDEKQLAQQIEAGREAEDELASNPPDDPERRAELERTVQAGHDAFDHFVSANLRLVVSQAAAYARRSRLDLGELIQEGNLGLIRAVEKFDWRRGLKFSTYATWWIRQALQRGMAGHERTIRIPAGVHQNLLKVRAAQARLDAELGRPPCIDEVGEATRLTDDEVRQALAADYAVASLDKPVSSEPDAAEFGALVAHASDSPADEVVERMFVEDLVDTARRTLPERSWYVLQRRYGLGGREPSTLQDVGDALGVSRETVRKIEQQALAQLREAFRAAA
jgi:RNA polymerase sigma factor (sigma-70 family)